MKKMYTKFFAFVMAIAMALSCTAVASAAEVDGSSCDASIPAMNNAVGSGDSGIMPLGSHSFVELDKRDLSDQQTLTGSFTYPGPGNNGSLIMACHVTGSVHVTVTINTLGLVKTLCSENITNTSSAHSRTWINIPMGSRVSYTVRSNGSTSRVIFMLTGYTAN